MTEAEFTRHKTMICPHCQGTVDVMVQIGLAGDLLPARDGTGTRPGAAPETSGRSGSETAFLEDSKKNGVFTAFEEAMRAGRPSANLPVDASGLFLLFFQKATRKAIPYFALEQYKREFRPAQIEVWGAEGVAAILADTFVKAFVPYSLLRGSQVKSLSGKLKARADIDEEKLVEWIRTKHGYVVGRGAFFEAMQKKSRGDFANPVL